MKTTTVSIPELALIAGTRGMLGMGIGLLAANRMRPEQRRAVGWTLVAVGVLTTIPLAADVLLGNGRTAATGRGAEEEVDETVGTPN
jgi:hypothetical protein